MQRGGNGTGPLITPLPSGTPSKRAAGPSIGPSSKSQRTRGASEGDGWVCEKCGNHNYEGRTFCNMRKCGAPGPWSCPQCGNKNFANREVCNMRNCNQARPPRERPGGINSEAAIQALSMLQASGLSNLPGVQESISKIIASAETSGVAGLTGPARNNQVQEGSWVCLGCGNINFPNRTSCNAKLCNRPRSEVDGGPPKPGASLKSIFMPGSWVCSQCQNINWPKREACGMRNCGMPRSQVDAGPPTPQTLAMHEGTWNCRHCGNLNYADREVCNMHTCGKPRD